MNSGGDFLSVIDRLNNKNKQGFEKDGKGNSENVTRTPSTITEFPITETDTPVENDKNESLENIPDGWKTDGKEKEECTQNSKQEETKAPAGRWNKDDIRNYGMLNTKTVEKEAEPDQVEMERMDRIGRMKMLREKLRLSRRRSEQTPITHDLELKSTVPRVKTLRGQKLLASTRMENKRVQNEEGRVIIGRTWRDYILP